MWTDCTVVACLMGFSGGRSRACVSESYSVCFDDSPSGGQREMARTISTILLLLTGLSRFLCFSGVVQYCFEIRAYMRTVQHNFGGKGSGY